MVCIVFLYLLILEKLYYSGNSIRMSCVIGIKSEYSGVHNGLSSIMVASRPSPKPSFSY